MKETDPLIQIMYSSKQRIMLALLFSKKSQIVENIVLNIEIYFYTKTLQVYFADVDQNYKIITFSGSEKHFSQLFHWKG